MLVRFDAGGPDAIRKILVDLEGDGEPGVQLSFDPPTDGTRFIDGRYVRALSYKPTVNGVWPLTVTVTDAKGCVARSGQIAFVTVVQ